MKDTLSAATAIMIFACLVLLGPLIAIASLNTILEQANTSVYIPHNFWTYISMYGLGFVFISRGGK